MQTNMKRKVIGYLRLVTKKCCILRFTYINIRYYITIPDNGKIFYPDFLEYTNVHVCLSKVLVYLRKIYFLKILLVYITIFLIGREFISLYITVRLTPKPNAAVTIVLAKVMFQSSPLLFFMQTKYLCVLIHI